MTATTTANGTHEKQAAGFRCGLSNVIQLGVKILLFLFPFAVAFATWLATGHFNQDREMAMQEKATELNRREIEVVKKELDTQAKAVNHLDVIEERLASLVQSVADLRMEVREVQDKL